MLAALSFLLATSTCESYEENPEYWWIGGGVVAAVIVAIVALSGGGDDDSDDDNGNGDLPDAPANLTATATAEDQIDLSWDAPAEDGGSAITGYRIEYKESDGDWSDLETDTESTDTDYSHAGLTGGSEYSYRIYAINANGAGPASDVAMATTDSDSPGAPANLAATPNGSSQIDLSWEAPADDGGSAIIGYRIEYKEGASGYMDAESDTGNTDTDYSHAGLTGGSEYSYRVYAINANGAGPASEEATATTVAQAEDPKPGSLTNLVAIPGDGQVTLSWDDPQYCGGLDLCTATAHQHWLEYKLISASEWGEGQAVAGNPHATAYIVTGLVNDMQYDFRLSVRLDRAEEGGPPAIKTVYAGPNSDGDEEPDSIDTDDDNDGVADTGDAFPTDACASLDTDTDGFPDTVLASGSTAPGGNAACSATSPLVEDDDDDNDGIADARDAFPTDACASVDSDRDGDPDTLLAPGDSDMDACTVASALAEDSDDDNDGTADTDDVDDDNDGLIEIASRAELENLRHNLAGSSYDDEAEDSGTGDSGDTTGAPTEATPNCDTASGGVYLCGYELANDIDLDGFGSDNVTCDSSKKWAPIGGCGSDGTCGETDDPTTPETETSDDDPFSAIFEGNGFTISNLCIEGDGDATDIDVLGLFGHLRGATVRNLTIAELYVEGSFTAGVSGVAEGTIDDQDNNRLGGLAGYATGDTTILNVAVADGDNAIDVQGAATNDYQYIGGLLGEQVGGGITVSYATGDVNAGDAVRDRAGGLVGQQAGGSITASYATGNVDGGETAVSSLDYVGGLVGRQIGGSITASYATGDVYGGETGGLDRVGGLVGEQIGGSITASYATGDVDGGGGTGDLAASLIGGNFLPGSITASYGFGTVTRGESSTLQNSRSDGTAKPMGVTTAAGLTAGNAGASWSAAVYDFGDSGQAPALKYISDYARGDGPDATAYTSDDRHTYSCDAASFPAALAVSCGSTLLGGPAGSPQDR